MSKKNKKVLLIGWDAADWQVIHPLMDAGKMPAMERLVNNGVMGNISTLEPVLSPMLWSSITTGKYAFKHGVHGFTEPDPNSESIRPVSSLSRKAKGIWNILNQNGYKSNVISWWPSHPAEPINGVMVSNFYQRANKSIDKAWEMAKGTVHPESLAETIAALRVHPQELTEAHVKPFIPRLAEINQEEDKRVEMFCKILADTASVHSAGTWCVENTEWDFSAIYFDGIDHFSHGFMKYHPPQLPGLPDTHFELYKDIINGAYIFHDMILERYLQLIDDDTYIILVSDHGFHSDHLRLTSLPHEPAAPAFEHRRYGIFCMSGPGIKKDETLTGVSLLDIAPTVLHLFGLPIGEDMDGKVLVNAFEEPQKIKLIDSWENVAGNSGMHPKEMAESSADAKNAIDQLVELGYIDRPDENAEKARNNAYQENRYNLAQAYIGANKHQEAIDVLLELHQKSPDSSRFTLKLSDCYAELNRNKEAREMIQLSKENITKEREALKNSKNKRRKVNPENIPTDFKILDLKEAKILIDENKPKEALEILTKLDVSVSKAPNLHLHIGRCYILLKKWKKAEEHFKTSLNIDPHKATALHGLGTALLRQNKYEEAIENFLLAIEHIYNFPFAHYHLGEALFYIKEYEAAANAFEVCLSQNPAIGKARNWLIEIYTNHIQKPENSAMIEKVEIENNIEEKIEEQKEAIKRKALGTITVVSGLPRSGTSMMMQMLEQGGMDIFTDKKREADESNPKGYYEHEAVKGTMKNNKWVNEVGDKAVKVISQLLPSLPARYNYKIIFMERELNEVIDSQHKMLTRDGKIKEGEYRTGLEIAFKNNLDKVNFWATKNHHVEILKIPYTAVIEDPKTQAEKINEFLGNKLDTNKMAAVVDAKLYRSKV